MRCVRWHTIQAHAERVSSTEIESVLLGWCWLSKGLGNLARMSIDVIESDDQNHKMLRWRTRAQPIKVLGLGRVSVPACLPNHTTDGHGRRRIVTHCPFPSDSIP